jgi:hypothetical protein
MLVASIVFGVVYDAVGPAAAFIMGASLSAAAAVLLSVVPLSSHGAAVTRAHS